MIFGFIAVGSLSVAGACALVGLWVPLPFAGGELSLLGVCLMKLNRQRAWNDEIVVRDSEVVVRQGGPGRADEERFHPVWIQVHMKLGRYRSHRRQLILRCYGRELEVGSFLCEAEREQLASALKESLRPFSPEREASGSVAA